MASAEAKWTESAVTGSDRHDDPIDGAAFG
jgi:hypothetical protein